MFSHPDIISQKAGSNSEFTVFPPITPTINTHELRNGLTKSIAAFGVIKNNCNIACNTALELNDKKPDFQMTQSLNSCVRRCFVERLKSHLPEDNQVVDFAYSSAFTFNQKDLFYLNLNKISLTDKVEDVKFNDIENIAKSFNNYFS